MLKKILLSLSLLIAPMQIRSFMVQPFSGSMPTELTSLRIDLNPDQTRSEEGFNDISNFLFRSSVMLAGSIAIGLKAMEAAFVCERYGQRTAESIPRKASSALAASSIIGTAVILKNLSISNSENLPILAVKGFSVFLLSAFSWGLLTPRPRPQAIPQARPQARTEAEQTTAELGARMQGTMLQAAQNQNQENVAPVIHPQEQPHRASPPQSDAPEGLPEQQYF